MTFYLDNRYPDRVNKRTAQYPRGSFKNRSAPDQVDGTYLEQDWKNDERGFFEKIINEAGIIPNGKIDNGEECQLYDGLMSLIQGRIQTSTTTLWAMAGGTSDAITAQFDREVPLKNGVQIYVRMAYANQTQAPTLRVNNGVAKTIVKGANNPLMVGDIQGAGFIAHLMFDERFDRWMMLNAAYGVSQPQFIPVGTIAYFGRKGSISGWLALDGGVYYKSDYQALVSECPELCRSYDSSRFRLPDTRNYFIRSSWSRGIGDTQGDCQRRIHGQFNVVDRGFKDANGAFKIIQEWASNIRHGNGDNWVSRLDFDSDRVVSSGSEVRPVNMSFPLYVKY
jgi:hypothetical protein|nr:MAG TPA: tail collar domain protein [Caudoviricetes sp.]